MFLEREEQKKENKGVQKSGRKSDVVCEGESVFKGKGG